MPARKKPVLVPQTSLIEIHDALAIAKSTVDTAAQALLFDRQATGHVAIVLDENVSRPLDAQRARIAQIVEHLVKPRRRKKRAPNGSRKGKKRQRNRWKDRQKAKKPWDL